MIQIQPIQIPLRDSTAHYTSMRSEFNLNDDTSIVQWIVFDENKNLITYGTVNIPSNVHTNWGNDDSHIEDYVLYQLNLSRL